MHKFRLSFAIMAAAVFCSAFAPAVKAATDGPHASTGGIPAATTDWVSSLTFPTFDPTLGTLNSVKLLFTSSYETTITVNNTSPDPSSGSAKTEIQFVVQDPGNNLVGSFIPPDPGPPTLDLYSPAFSYSLAGGGSTTSGLLANSGGDSNSYTLAAILAEFTGTGGSMTLSAATFTQTVVANTGGNTAASQVSDASLDGTVTYFYTPVPEPSTVVLLGFGAVSMLVCGRRRLRSA